MKPHIVRILSVVCKDVFGFEWSDLQRKKRTSDLAWARQVVMVAMMEQFHQSPEQAAREFGLTQGSAIHAAICVKNRILTDRLAKKHVKSFLGRLYIERAESQKRQVSSVVDELSDIYG